MLYISVAIEAVKWVYLITLNFLFNSQYDITSGHVLHCIFHEILLKC